MISQKILMKAFGLMCTSRAMARIYEQNRSICKYVHSTSQGHEAIQLATAFNLENFDCISPYYRDESLLLGLGYTPYELMLQLLAKKNDPFTGGRSYYCHPNNKKNDKPLIIHQSSATGMQAIPTTGMAQGIQYLELINSPLCRKGPNGELPVVVCSLGDGSVTEGEVSEAFQFAILKKLPIIYLIQDNKWGISASSEETRVAGAYDYAAGFPGLERFIIDGSDFTESYETMQRVIDTVRTNRSPCLIQANVPLLGHHTSGVRKEAYRKMEDVEKHAVKDPLARLRNILSGQGIAVSELELIEKKASVKVGEDFEKACAEPEPDPALVSDYIFMPTAVMKEMGLRSPKGGAKVMMVDATLYAMREILEDNPEAIFFGQDVGRALGGVFREAATLAASFGSHRVFNTAIQEAYIIGSTAGLSAVGVKPIVEIQFADYVYPGISQLVTEISKSCYLTCGKFPVQTLIRIPVGAYGGGGPYHSSSIETTLLSIKGIKVVYPSNAADMKGLLKAAFHDPNPVIILEHKGLYWGKLPGTEEAKSIEPSRDYIIPLGKANIILKADDEMIGKGTTCSIITYGMGVYWARIAALDFPGRVEIIDLRTLFPLDEDLIYSSVRSHGKCLVITEEQQNNSFAESLAARISQQCFQWLDAPVDVLGAMNMPSVPINRILEKEMLPGVEKVRQRLNGLLNH